MPLDTSIALGVRAPEIVDPSKYAQMAAEQQMNALRGQVLQQNMQQNALTMQNTMEDRRRAEAARQQSAAEKAALKAQRAQILKEANNDPVAAASLALKYGYTGLAEDFAKARESVAKAGSEEAELEKRAFANSYQKNAAYAPLIANGAVPGRAVVAAMFDDPVMGGVLSRVMTRDEALAFADQNPQGLAQILATPPDKIYESIAAPMKYSVQDTAQGVMRVPETGTGPAIPLTDEAGKPIMPVDRRSVTNIDMKGQGKFAEELGTLQARKLIEGQGAAQEAVSVLDTINVGRRLLDKGVISGFGADFKLGFAKAAKELGAEGFDGKIENTEAYAANMAKNVGALIKQFGSGTGLSNADREYAEKMAGGQTALDEKSLRKILDISERAARKIIETHNKRAERVKSDLPLTVEMPSQTSAGGSANAIPPHIQSIVDQYKNTPR